MAEVAPCSDTLRSGEERPTVGQFDVLPVVSLQGPGHQAAHGAVRGDDVKLVRLLDVDGEVGDGLATDLQLLLGVFSSHVRCELGLTLAPPHQGCLGRAECRGLIDQLSVTRAWLET